MKKLFIGCGILVALLLGGVGFLVYRFGPMFMEAAEKIEQLGFDLQALDRSYPFEEQPKLDPQRFASALDLRRQMQLDFTHFTEDLDAFGNEVESEDLGIREIIQTAMDRMLPILDKIPANLESAQMGPTEFAYHCRVVWATLESIDAGAAGAGLDPLRGRYENFRGAYGVIRSQDDTLPPLDELLGEFDPGVLLTAKGIMENDTDRVLDGIADPNIEALYMRIESFSSGMADYEPVGAGDTGDGGGETPQDP